MEHSGVCASRDDGESDSSFLEFDQRVELMRKHVIEMLDLTKRENERLERLRERIEELESQIALPRLINKSKEE